MAAQAFIDGLEVTSSCLSGSVTRRLNGPAQATLRLPITLATGGVGSRIKVAIDGGLYFHGFCLQTSDDCGEDIGYTEYTATDPWEMWQWRPARDRDDGDFSKPSFFETEVTGPQIFRHIVENSFAWDGDLFIDINSDAAGGVDLSGAPTDWPMTLAEIADLLTSTGEVDIVLSPIDSGGNMARLDIYNGNYGSDLTGSVIFDYETGFYNVRQLRQVIDGTNMCNKLWYYGGPRVGTSADPAGDQHWCWNITGSDPGLPDPPKSAVLSKRAGSQGAFGVRMEIKIFDALGEECPDPFTMAERDLYRRLWLLESWIRAEPRRLVHFIPVRNTPIGFGIGDLITVRAGSVVRGGFSGAQRVYAFTVTWDSEGVTELGELVTSPDSEGF